MSKAFMTVMAVLFASTLGANAAVFQYSVPVAQPDDKPARKAFLWIPPNADRVRGIIVGGMTLIEREFVKDPAIRQACAEQKLALLFFNCGLGSVNLDAVLADLTKASGYQELPLAPMMVIGHSAGGPQAKALAYKIAPRCFGLIQFRGGLPAKEGDITGDLHSVPALVAIGQFDEFGGTMRREDGRETWMGGRDGVARFRAENERNLVSIIVEPGAGHFAWSDRMALYVAKFVRKAAQARIPGDWPIDAKEPVKCTEVDPHGGWLTDLTINSQGEFAPAPYDQYKGDKTQAAWQFDEEMAMANVAFHAGQFGGKDQFIKWGDSFWVDAGARYFFNKIDWVGDGQTFVVHPVYDEVYPKQYNGQGPRWPEAGNPVGNSGTQVFVKQVSGPVVPVGPHTFRMKYDALAPATDGGRVTFMAYSLGNKEYRYTERVGMMPRNFGGLQEGKDQTITFPPIGNVKAGSGAMELKATSDSGLPVEYYVAYGPAVIEGNRLILADMPARAKFPIEVKVVAYQFGSGVEPKVKTAAPVEQVFQIEQP